MKTLGSGSIRSDTTTTTMNNNSNDNNDNNNDNNETVNNDNNNNSNNNNNSSSRTVNNSPEQTGARNNHLPDFLARSPEFLPEEIQRRSQVRLRGEPEEARAGLCAIDKKKLGKHGCNKKTPTPGYVSNPDKSLVLYEAEKTPSWTPRKPQPSERR